MEALTLKELKKIEKWYAQHEEDMDGEDSNLYEKINIIIEDMEDVGEESSIDTTYEDSEDEDSDEDNYCYEEEIFDID